VGVVRRRLGADQGAAQRAQDPDIWHAQLIPRCRHVADPCTSGSYVDSAPGCRQLETECGFIAHELTLIEAGDEAAA
jgi:hypothetical protein